MAATTGQIAQLLLPGIRKLTGEYREMPVTWNKIFARGESDMAVEKSVAMRFLPLPALKIQGGATSFDNAPGQRFTYSHVPLGIGLGYSFSHEAIADNLYKSQFNPTNLGLLRSFRQMKEIMCASILNTGTTFNPLIGGDQLALFATSHPVDGFTVPNTPTFQVGLNEMTLLLANNQIRRFRDNAGLLVGAQGRKLVVPVELRHVAKRLCDTPLRPGTSDNDVAVVHENEDLADGYIAWDFLSSPFAWFVVSDVGGLLMLQREEFTTSMWVDNTTDNLLVKAYERFAASFDDWRAVWGSFPLS